MKFCAFRYKMFIEKMEHRETLVPLGTKCLSLRNDRRNYIYLINVTVPIVVVLPLPVSDPSHTFPFLKVALIFHM
jgi:hypothetical protein